MTPDPKPLSVKELEEVKDVARRILADDQYIDFVGRRHAETELRLLATIDALSPQPTPRGAQVRDKTDEWDFRNRPEQPKAMDEPSPAVKRALATFRKRLAEVNAEATDVRPLTPGELAALHMHAHETSAEAKRLIAEREATDEERARAFWQKIIRNEFGAISEYDDIFDVNALAAEFASIRAEAVEKWQPIETAPKTGDDLLEKCILAYCKEEHPNDRFKVVWWEPMIKGGVWWSDQDLECKPLYWMPLPAPPQAIRSAPPNEGG